MQAPHGAAHLDQVKRHNAMRCLHCRTVHRPGHEAFFWAVSASSGAFIRAGNQPAAVSGIFTSPPF